MSDSEMRQYMSEEVRSAVYNELTAEDNQKTNLEETDSASHKQAKKHHKKHKHAHKTAPKQDSNLAASAKSQNILEQNS